MLTQGEPAGGTATRVSHTVRPLLGIERRNKPAGLPRGTSHDDEQFADHLERVVERVPFKPLIKRMRGQPPAGRLDNKLCQVGIGDPKLITDKCGEMDLRLVVGGGPFLL